MTMPFEVPPAWIPAEGTPPDDDRYVLVAKTLKPHEGYDDVEVLGDVLWYDERTKTWNDEHGRTVPGVIFWQPLPPLPREEERRIGKPDPAGFIDEL